MSEEETFEVSAEEPAARRESVAEKRVLHITVVDHTPIVEGNDEVSYIDLKIPLGMAEAGLKMVPEGKLGQVDPDLIVQMVEMGAVGELVNINEEKKTVSIRVE
jgi:hypothetical protein